MANGQTSKKRTTKSTTSRNRKRTTNKRRGSSQHATQVWGVVLFALGIFLAISLYTDATGIVGETLADAMRGIGGLFSYAIPVLVMMIGLFLMLSPKRRPTRRKVLLSCLGLYAFMCILHLLTVSPAYSSNYFSAIGYAFDAGISQAGGCGVLCELAIWPVGQLLGDVGNYILWTALLIISIILLFNISLSDTAQKTKTRVQNSRDGRAQKKSARAQQPELEAPMQPQPEQAVPYEPFAEQAPIFVDMDDVPAPPETAFHADSTARAAGTGSRGAGRQGAHADDAPAGVRPSKVYDDAPQASRGSMEIEYAGGEREYEVPPLELLTRAAPTAVAGAREAAKDNAQKLENTLSSFGVSARVVKVTRGPTVTQYEVQPAPGIRVSKIAGLSDNIALDLAAPTIRIEAPIPGKSAIGIEVPNPTTAIVSLLEVLESDAFQKARSPLCVALGKNIAGQPVVADLQRMPHLLIAGATGSGKSVCINNLLMSLLYKASPEQVRLILVDPKVVELSIYNAIPHLLIPVVTDSKQASEALNWATREMDNRYLCFAQHNVRDLEGYNQAMKQAGEDTLPSLVVIIDELADLMMVAPKDIEDSICRLAQKGRACGIHLVVATQRPSVNVITGVIKANIPSRIAFSVTSQVDSRTILDMAGAEKLLGKGDMLYYPTGIPKPVRLQGAFVSDKEVEAVTDFVKSHSHHQYDESVSQAIAQPAQSQGAAGGGAKLDDKLLQALEIAVDTGQVSISMLQRRLGVGYSRAGRLVDEMEKMGAISGFSGSKSRNVLITREEFDSKYAKPY